MDYLLNTFLWELKQNFETLDFTYRKIEYGGSVSVFFVYIADEISLKENWESISVFIASGYQATMADEFNVWNIYLFFVLREVVSNELKYQIENDTFSSRKIIVFPIQPEDDIVNEHILNNDLQIPVRSTTELGEFQYDSIIGSELRGAVAKKRLTDDMKQRLNEVVTKIRLAE